MRSIFFTFITVLLAFSSQIKAQVLEFDSSGIIILDQNTTLLNISKSISFIEDAECTMSFDDVTLNNEFKRSPGLLNLGVTKSCYWLRFVVENRSDRENFHIFLGHPIIDLVEFYNENGLVESISEKNPFYDRSIDDPNFTFELDIPQGQQKSFYLKISGSELIVVPLTIGVPDKVRSAASLREMLTGLYAGIILVMFIYNLFVYFSVRDISYLYYVLYILFIGLTQTSLKGFTAKYMWPDSFFLNHFGVTLFSCLAGLFALEFVKVFLHTKEQDPFFHKISYGISTLFIVSIGITLFDEIQISFSLMQIATVLGSIYALTVAYRIFRMGFRPAKFFLIAWSILLIGALIFVLKDFEILPFNNYTNYSLQLASVFEVILLSFALADKINIMRVEKEESQQAELLALEENDRIIREQNIILEAKVEERTSSLKKANSSLNIAMDDLKSAQSKLVSAEKMASLGQLTAGIAHEINNPINYVKSSIRPLRDNVTEILELIDEYEENLQKVGNVDAEKAIKAFKEKIEFDYLLEETQDVINNIEEGANRTAEIVSGLRTFSHVDDLGIKLNDINKGIKSTLKLLSGEIPYECKINLNLGEIGDIECYGGKMNQVFMNILNNALQAMKMKNIEICQLDIETKAIDDCVQISILDNGIGMDEETIEKIFDPFFTTKDVGEGTGLGLSVVYGIIQSHHGTIEVQSELGKGSTFIIKLPYIQPK